MILHGYWRSGASYRVRIALNLKGIGYDNAAHDLRKGDQKTPDYVALNPQGMVPALQDGDFVLTQSPASPSPANPLAEHGGHDAKAAPAHATQPAAETSQGLRSATAPAGGSGATGPGPRSRRGDSPAW